MLKNEGILRDYTKSNRDVVALDANIVSSNTYKIKTGYEKDMTVYCPPKKLIMYSLRTFKEINIGVSEFNYIGTSNLKCFWVITEKNNILYFTNFLHSHFLKRSFITNKYSKIELNMRCLIYGVHYIMSNYSQSIKW